MNETFDTEDLYEITKSLSGIFFSTSEEKIPLEDYLKEYKAKDVIILNANRVVAVVGKSFRAKLLLYNYYKEKQTLNQDKIKDYLKGGAYYTCAYLKNIIDVFSYDDKIFIETREDFPIILENDDFRFILSPRGDS